MDLTVGTDHLWPWAPVPVAIAVGFLLTWWAVRRRRRSSDEVLVAGTAALRTLPRFRQLARRGQLVGSLLTLAALVVVTGAALALTRPQDVDVRPGQERGRDVMICLDASYSMLDDNAEVVREVRRITGELDGDRVGLMVWSGAAVLVVPLTDDAAQLRAGLDRAEDAFTLKNADVLAGIDLPANRASLIGDGIVSCIERMPEENDRVRAVLVTSDNDPLGQPVYALPEAGQYAADRGVVLYGLGPPSLAVERRRDARQQFDDAVSSTGGLLGLLGTDGSTADLVDRIDALEESRRRTPDTTVRSDDAGLGAALCLAGVVALGIGWAGQGVARLVFRRSR